MDATSGSHIHLRPEQYAAYEAQCDALVERALGAHARFHSSDNLHEWKCVRQRGTLSVYRRRETQAEKETTARSSWMLCSGVVPGTLDDVLNGVYCDSSESLRVVKSILSDKFLDGHMVHVVERNALDAPIIFRGIKYFIVQSPGGALIVDRDVLTYERMGRVEDDSGQCFAYHVLHSVDLPEYSANGQAPAPSLASSKRLCRAVTSMCYLYRQITEDWVGCFMVGDFDANGSLPVAISEYLVADTFLSVGKVLECSQAKKFSNMMLAAVRSSRRSLAPTLHSKCCALCMVASKLLGPSLKACAACHRRVCRRCRSKRTIFRLNARSRRPDKERFCRECVDQVIDTVGHGGKPNPPGTGRYDTAVSSTSSSSNWSASLTPWSSADRTPGSRALNSTLSTRMGLSAVSVSSRTSSSTSPSGFSKAGEDEAGESNLVGHGKAWTSHTEDEDVALRWNSEEFTRLSSIFRSSRSKQTKEGKTKKRMLDESNPMERVSIVVPPGSTLSTPRTLDSSKWRATVTSSTCTPSSSRTPRSQPWQQTKDPTDGAETPRTPTFRLFARGSTRTPRSRPTTPQSTSRSRTTTPRSIANERNRARSTSKMYDCFAEAVAARQQTGNTSSFKTTVMFNTAPLKSTSRKMSAYSNTNVGSASSSDQLYTPSSARTPRPQGVFDVDELD